MARPATSIDFMNLLPTVTLCKGLLDEPAFCTICIEEIKLGERASKLPCSHIFHRSCILEALHHTNTCPNCRLQFPKPDADQRVSQANRTAAGADLLDMVAQALITRGRNLPEADRHMREIIVQALLSRRRSRHTSPFMT